MAHPGAKIDPQRLRQAADLVFAGELPLYQIARLLGIDASTLRRWRQRPEFQAAIEARRREFRRQQMREIRAFARGSPSRYTLTKTNA